MTRGKNSKISTHVFLMKQLLVLKCCFLISLFPDLDKFSINLFYL